MLFRSRRDPGDQSELPAAPWSPLLLDPHAPSTRFLRGNPEPAPPLRPPRGRGRWHLLGASLFPGHQRSKAKGTAFGVREVRRGEDCLGVEGDGGRPERWDLHDGTLAIIILGFFVTIRGAALGGDGREE